MPSRVDPQLWRACARNMVHAPPLNSQVVYFPQGHAEHADGLVDFKAFPEIPAMVNCRVDGITYMADDENDDVYLRMRLIPMEYSGLEGDNLIGRTGEDGVQNSASFPKKLTQSDANNGGGFSVPKCCAESVFPTLDHSICPPWQTLRVKDVHGTVSEFRHIYRGTPRRHLLTTGWSVFVNTKKLVAGDTVVFFRAGNGELFVGTKRAKRGSVMRGRVTAETVVEAARLAADGSVFEVDYYPHAGSAEFCVKASAVYAALRTHWHAGMRFKMAFEPEDASKVRWLLGTIEGVESADPVRWPDSPWQRLQVRWDEANLVPSADRVSPWLADIVPDMDVVPYAPAMKRLRIEKGLDFPPGGQCPAGLYAEDFIPNLADNAPAGVQGARHVQYGQLPDFQPLELHLIRPLAGVPPPVGMHAPAPKGNSEIVTSSGFVLFGKLIFTAEQLLKSSSAAKVASDSNTLSDGNKENPTGEKLICQQFSGPEAGALT